jgi:hypothetical protein
MNIKDIKSNPNNPRIIKDERFEKLKKSIKEFPKMMALRPMVINQDNIVLGGNMRLKALKELGYTELPDEWVKRAEDLTDEEARRFIIADNVGFGEHDWEMLANEWDTQELEDWGLEGFPFDDDGEKEEYNKLEDKFIVPPFSVLDTKQGYWQKRKKYWKGLIGDNGESREDKLSNLNNMSAMYRPEMATVSILDPVLAEISNKWFGLDNCNTFDCFAGDSVFGYVSDALGNTFTGIELRKEQADLNNNRLKGSKSKYICDDGQNVLKHIKEKSQDLLFSCPPYFDLEVYSDLPTDASNQKEYNDFLQILDNAFSDSIKCLKDNRFAFIVVGDIRAKDGTYYKFPDHIKKIFTENGMSLYNEMILLDPLGTAPARANKYMKSRKVVKVHQNILVFYKGDTKNIKNIYKELDFSSIEYESEDV